MSALTLTELIEMVRDIYPNAEPDTTIIRHMNSAIRSLNAKKMGLLVEDVSVLTVVDQESYTFPTGLLDVNDIDYLAISSDSAPADRYEYIQYYPGYANDLPNKNYRYFQTYTSSGVKKLGLYPIPSTANLVIMIRFFKEISPLSIATPTATPEFDSNFHELLAYYAVHQIAASGSSPDKLQADFYGEKYKDCLSQMRRMQMNRSTGNSRSRRDNPIGFWRSRSY